MAASHFSNKVRLCGVLIQLLTEVSLKASSEQTPVHGTSRDPIDFTLGANAYELSITMTREEYETKAKPALLREAPSLARAKGSLFWNVTEPGSPQSNREARFQGAKEWEATSSEGAETQVVKLSFSVKTVLEDGKPIMGA